MTVYMGEGGLVEIQRTAVNSGFVAANLGSGDVDVTKRRFSLDIPASSLITGDRVEIATQDGSILVLVAGHVEPDGYWYCNVDPVGGIRLYITFEDAINGRQDNALPLVAATYDQQVYIRTADQIYNCIAQMRAWSFTTTRDAVDTTVLGTYFREMYSDGLISGQGNITCIWDYRRALCDPAISTKDELPNYLAQLLLRVQQGSLFKGRFLIHTDPDTARTVWYEADCVVTNAGFNLAPGTVVDSSIDFVTTGEVKLLIGYRPSFLLQEDSDYLLQEDGSRIELDGPE